MARQSKAAFSCNSNGPACPLCKGAMTLRSGQYGAFWGCDGFPRCRGLVKVNGSSSYRQGASVVKRADEIKLLPGSDQQEKIWEYMTKGKGHAVVHALAGTGKTFTLLQGLCRMPRNLSMTYLAFNTDIKDEMLAKSPAFVQVKTFNAFGFAAINRSGVAKKIEVKADKYSSLFLEMFPATTEREEKRIGQNANRAKKLVELCQNYLLETTKENMVMLAEKHNVFEPSDSPDDIALVFKAVPALLERGGKMFNVISFSDQLWMPVFHNMAFEPVDILCVDESQDLNAVQHQIVIRTVGTKGRAIIVGDDNQAIYGFRGADSESINTMGTLLQGTKKEVKHFDLTMTRRCGRAIVDHCKQWVPTFEAHPSNPEGMVISTDETVAMNDGLFQPGTMTVCRMNAPLVELAYSLIAKGVKVWFVGREFGKALIGLVKGLGATSVMDLLERLEAYRIKEFNKLEAKKAKGRDVDDEIANLQDRTMCITIMAGRTLDASPDASVTELVAYMEDFFHIKDKDGAESSTRAKSCARLSSIHKAKGLEANTVLWLYPNIEIRVRSAWQAQQEINLKYVAASRAIDQLILCYEDKSKPK